MAPTAYADLSKSAKDLLKNDYQFDHKFKLSTKTAGGVSVTSEGVLGGKGTSGKLTFKGKGPLDGLNIGKACVDTKGRFTLESTLSGAVANTEFTVKASDGGGKAPAGSLSANYATSALNVELEADVVEGPTFTANTTFEYQNFTLGGTATYNTQFDNSDSSPSLEDYNAALAYNTGDLTVSLGSKKKLSAFDLGVYHKVNSDLQIAAVVGFGAGTPSMTVGGKQALSGGAAVTGKVDSAGVVSANWISPLQPGVKLITSAQVDATNFAGDSHKFGLTLQLSPK